MTDQLLDLSVKVVFGTGGSTGIGRATSLLFGPPGDPRYPPPGRAGAELELSVARAFSFEKT